MLYWSPTRRDWRFDSPSPRRSPRKVDSVVTGRDRRLDLSARRRRRVFTPNETGKFDPPPRAVEQYAPQDLEGEEGYP